MASIPVIIPTPAKRKKKNEENLFILCDKNCNEDKSSYSEIAWKNLKTKCLEWKGIQQLY